MATKKTETKTTKKAEAKKTETKKAEPKKDTRVWKTGHPTKSGVYEVKLDGKEQYMIWLHCDQCSRKGKWSTMDGQIPLGKELLWTGEPIPRDKRK